MPKSSLHTKIEAIAKDRGAMFISAKLLQATVLDSLNKALLFGHNARVLFPTGHAAVVARFESTSLNSRLTAELREDRGAFGVEISPAFSVAVVLQSADDPALEFSSIEIDVQNVVLPLQASGHFVTIGAANVPVIGRVAPKPTREAALSASTLVSEELLRIEGAMAYIGGARLVASALGDVPPIDLKRLFPALSFDGVLHIHSIDGGLLIVPDQFSLLGNPGCPQGDVMLGVEIYPQHKVDTGSGATWEHYVTLPATTQNATADAPPIVSTYLPKPVLDVHFGKTTPGVNYRDHDNGFIGYDVQLSAAIRGIKVTIDPKELGLRLKLDFAIWGLVTANIDVPCVGRMDLAQAKFELPENNGTASIEALLRLKIDTGGRLVVASELTQLDLGKAKVDIQLFSKYLGLAGGKAAVIGFILDAVIGRVVAHNLPGIIAEAIRNAVNQHFFVLADLSGILRYLPRLPSMPTFSGDARSALFGSAIKDG